MIKKAEEKRNRYLRIRQVWEGGPITCDCCNLPSQLILEGSVLRAMPATSRVRLTRMKIAELLYPVWKLADREGRARGVVCPRCERKRQVPEQRMYYIQVDPALRIGPICLDCVTQLVHAELPTDRITSDLPVWVVKCGAAALALMKHIDFSGVASTVREVSDGDATELLY